MKSIKDFPSLKGLLWDAEHRDGPYQDKNNKGDKEMCFDWVRKEDLIDNCIDNQRIKEVMDKVFQSFKDVTKKKYYKTWNTLQTVLLKELNLGDKP